jgi:L-asparaginase II
MMPDYTVTYRGGVVETRDAVHAAVVDGTGKLLFAVGDPARMTLARSAAKPAQTLAVLGTGAAEQFGFDDADLALMCSSHSSEGKHVERARAMLAKVGAAETDLLCGGHESLSDAVNRAWIKSDHTPTAINNNCSGKHAGMLGAARALGAPFQDYNSPDHPVQIRVREAVERLCGLDAQSVKWAGDGCNLPTPAAPLHNLARMYASLASAADAGTADGQARVFKAMAQHADMVGGEDRFDTDLMRVFRGFLIGKIGADGFYAIGLRASDDARRLGSDGAVGIAVKVEDAAPEMLCSVVMEILDRLNIGSEDMHKALSSYHQLERHNSVNAVIGNVAHEFAVRKC